MLATSSFWIFPVRSLEDRWSNNNENEASPVVVAPLLLVAVLAVELKMCGIGGEERLVQISIVTTPWLTTPLPSPYSRIESPLYIGISQSDHIIA